MPPYLYCQRQKIATHLSSDYAVAVRKGPLVTLPKELPHQSPQKIPSSNGGPSLEYHGRSIRWRSGNGHFQLVADILLSHHIYPRDVLSYPLSWEPWHAHWRRFWES